MTKRAKGFLIAGCVLLGVAGLTSGVRWLWITRDGTCIRTEPREIVAGRICREWPWSPSVYKLGYRGTYDVSSKECWTYICVTEAEYSRKMYREDP